VTSASLILAALTINVGSVRLHPDLVRMSVMKPGSIAGAVVAALAASVLATSLAGQVPIEPAKQLGSGVTPAYEGWFDSPDGSTTF